MSPRRPRRRARRRSRGPAWSSCSGPCVVLAGAPRRGPDPGVAAVAGLRRHLRPRAGRAGRRGGRAVQRDGDLGHGADGRDRHAEPAGPPDRARRDRPTGGRRVDPGRQRGRTRRRSGSVGTDFATVFADRAQAMRDLRAAVDGYLGMQPLPVAGTTDNVASTAGGRRHAPDGGAGDEPHRGGGRAAGALGLALRARCVARSRPRRATPGCRSRRGCAARSSGASARWPTQVDLIATSPSLAAIALPGPAHGPDQPAGPADTRRAARPPCRSISPTTQISVDVVLGNNGSVDEPHATVHFTMANQASGATSSHAETVALAADASQALPDRQFRRQAGHDLRAHGQRGPARRPDPDGRHGGPGACWPVAPATCVGPKGPLSTTCTPRS